MTLFDIKEHNWTINLESIYNSLIWIYGHHNNGKGNTIMLTIDHRFATILPQITCRRVITLFPQYSKYLHSNLYDNLQLMCYKTIYPVTV